MSTASAEARLGVDVGGTFTDVVLRNRDGSYSTAKVPTTPARITDGILAGMEQAGAAAADVDVFVHGTTIALNALLEGKTPPVSLVTTAGFRDVLEIMRTNRKHMYDLMQEKPVPLVPRHLRAEVSARLNHLGEPVRDVSEGELHEIARSFSSAGVVGVAVCLLHSYANPLHEREIGRALAALLPGVQISLSSDLTREWREFERTSTTVINAATMPIMSRYLADLAGELEKRRFAGRLLIMQSNGGVTSAADARERPVASLMSGPSGAVAGGVRLANQLGPGTNLVTLDMGGTSADVAVIDRGEPTTRTIGEIGGWPILVPSLEIEAIGAGGGSLARVDAFGALSVGPESAGSVPGPACYRRGGTGATVTDAHVVLARIDASQVLGGTVALDGDAARRAIDEAVARPFGMTLEQAAEGVITVADSNMTRLLWEMIIGRGRDPRDFSLVALGGGGGLHACELAEALAMKSVIVPSQPGAFSAWGMLAADMRHDYSQTISTGRDGSDPAVIDTTFEELERIAHDRLTSHSAGSEAFELIRSAEVRYHGQRSGLPVALPSDARAASAIDAAFTGFESEHQRLFGFARPGHRIEIVRLQLSAIGRQHVATDAGSGRSGGSIRRATRPVYCGGRHRDAIVLKRHDLDSSARCDGPCIVEELTATTYVPPGWTLRVDANRNLHITPTAARQEA